MRGLTRWTNRRPCKACKEAHKGDKWCDNVITPEEKQNDKKFCFTRCATTTDRGLQGRYSNWRTQSPTNNPAATPATAAAHNQRRSRFSDLFRSSFRALFRDVFHSFPHNVFHEFLHRSPHNRCPRPSAGSHLGIRVDDG